MDLENSKNSLTEMIKELEDKIDIEFKEGIRKINLQFDELFKIMFGGGNASLEVIREKIRRKGSGALSEAVQDLGILDTVNEGLEPPDPFLEGEEGIDISVELPHKKTKGLVMLSGGERALTSIALLFAMSTG